MEKNFPAAADDVLKAKSTPQYSVAYELELWKKAEENAFRAKLAEDERIRRLRLQAEYAGAHARACSYHS